METFKKMRNAYREGRLVHVLNSRAKRFSGSLKYMIYDPAFKRVILHCPEYVAPSDSKDEKEIVERIFQSFKKMKEDQKNVSELYLPSSLWQQQLDIAYSYLSAGLKTNDLNKFHYFLSNFGTWKTYHGIEPTTLIWDNMRTFLGRRYLKNAIFYKQLKFWQWFYNNRRPISSLSYPSYGNQSGAYLDGIFIGANSFHYEIYGSILNGLISDIDRPVLSELGAGYGKLAFFTLRNIDNFCFIDFDLPETLCVAAYYLMKCWPNKRVLLYGEGEYSQNAHNHYDLIFMPSYLICNLGRNSTDLFINMHSLGEMTKEAVNNYINYITESTRYFVHMNHDIYRITYSNSEFGLLGYEYPVSKDKFKLLFRYPDMGQVLHEGYIDYRQDIFLYLYERKTE